MLFCLAWTEWWIFAWLPLVFISAETAAQLAQLPMTTVTVPAPQIKSLASSKPIERKCHIIATPEWSTTSSWCHLKNCDVIPSFGDLGEISCCEISWHFFSFRLMHFFDDQIQIQRMTAQILFCTFLNDFKHDYYCNLILEALNLHNFFQVDNLVNAEWNCSSIK